MAKMSKRMNKMFANIKKQNKTPLNACKKTAYLSKQAN